MCKCFDLRCTEHSKKRACLARNIDTWDVTIDRANFEGSVLGYINNTFCDAKAEKAAMTGHALENPRDTRGKPNF